MPFQPPDTSSTVAFVVVVLAVLLSVLGGGMVAARRMSRSPRAEVIRVAGVLALWVGGTSLPVLAGRLQGEPLPALPLFFATVLIGALAFAIGPIGRRLAALPLAGLVAFQAFRLPLELVLHSWAKQGSIPTTMTYEGQNFDIATGVLALLLAPLARRSVQWARVFNILGMALLMNVLRVVVMSSPLPFAWGVEPPLVLAAYAPYHLIATVCVAGALAGHIILFRAIARATAPVDGA